MPCACFTQAADESRGVAVNRDITAIFRLPFSTFHYFYSHLHARTSIFVPRSALVARPVERSRWRVAQKQSHRSILYL